MRKLRPENRCRAAGTLRPIPRRRIRQIRARRFREIPLAVFLREAWKSPFKTFVNPLRGKRGTSYPMSACILPNTPLRNKRQTGCLSHGLACPPSYLAPIIPSPRHDSLGRPYSLRLGNELPVSQGTSSTGGLTF